MFNGFFGRAGVPLLGLLLTMSLTFSGCSADERKVAAVNSFSYGHGGMSAWECYSFTVRRIGTGAQVEFEVAGEQEPLIKEADPQILETLRELIEKHKLLKWDGFKGPNPPHVCDGTSFSLNVTLADGKKIEAHGSNNFPKGYRDAVQEIRELLEPYRQEMRARRELREKKG